MRASNVLWFLAVESVVAFPPFRTIRVREDSVAAAAKEAVTAEEVPAPDEVVEDHQVDEAVDEAEAVKAVDKAKVVDEVAAHIPAEADAEKIAAHPVEADVPEEADEEAHPEASVPEEAHPQAVAKPEAAHPEAVVEPEAAHPKAVVPEEAHPEGSVPEEAHPQAVTEPDDAHPEAVVDEAKAEHEPPAAAKVDAGVLAEAGAADGAECEAICAERQQSVTYTVQPQDTLGKIAKSLGSGICDIAAANTIDSIDVIFPNQTLTVPVTLAAPDDASCVTAPLEATCVEGGEGTAVVQEGDAFVTIAAGLGISSGALVAANPDADRFDLQAGQVINVPVCSGAAGEVPAAAAEEVAAAVEAAEAAGAVLTNTSSATTKRWLRMKRNRGGSTALFQLTKGGTAN